jgi:hypothetical protein
MQERAMRSLPAARTPEDDAIFDRMYSMGPEWIYQDGDRSDAVRMLTFVQDRARHDLASPVVRILGEMP